MDQTASDTCRALLELDKLGRRKKRPYMSTELRLLAQMYADRTITLEEMAERLRRPLRSVNDMLDMCIPNRDRRAEKYGVRDESRRRASKIVEALLRGDSWDSVGRRWGSDDAAIYYVLRMHRLRTGMSHTLWRRLFFGREIRQRLTCTAKPDTKGGDNRRVE
jgi:hypothetical protein